MTTGSPALSVIVNGHNEGALYLVSVRSVFAALRTLRNHRPIPAEIVLVGDALDAATERVFDAIELPADLRDVTLASVKVAHRDLGLARNSGVARARGQWVAFLDGDDLMCESWLWRALAEAERHPPQAVLHAELFCGFQDEYFIRTQNESDDPGFDPFVLASDWQFCNDLLARRETFVALPFASSDHASGFGAEDWHRSCESIARGYVHRRVPETVYFYRRRRHLVSLGDRPNIIYKRTSLFDSAELRERSRAVARRAAADPGRRRQLTAYAIARRVRYFVPAWIQGLLMTWVERRFGKPSDGLPPEWMMAEAHRAAKLESLLFPDAYRDCLHIFPNPRAPVGQALAEMLAQLQPSYDVVIACPWLKHGGADRMTLAYAEALAADRRVLILTTASADNPLASQRDPRVDHLAVMADERFRAMNEESASLLFTRLLLQLSPAALWIVNSDIAGRALQRYGRQMSSVTRILASVFGPSLTRDGLRLGFGYTEPRRHASLVAKVLTDNEAVIRSLVGEFGLEPELFRKLPSPVPESLFRAPAPPRPVGAPVRVLWAGRLDYDKRTDLLAAIVVAAPDGFEFHAHGDETIADAREWPARIKASPRVTYHGRYARFEDIPASYDVLLYTTHSDGMPNVLLEAAARALPVIAPDVGGIGELLDRDSPFFVRDKESVPQFLDALAAFAKLAPAERARIGGALQARVRDNHSPLRFAAEVRDVVERAISGRR